MSQRNTKMMMVLAQKNKLLREKFKGSKKLRHNIQSIDPDFFPSSDDSDDDSPFSRYDCAGQSLAQISQSSNYSDTEDLNFLPGPSTSKVDYFSQQQDDQNFENRDNNTSTKSLFTLTAVPITKNNGDLTDILSSVLFPNNCPEKNVFNLDVPSTETLLRDAENDQQKLYYSQKDEDQNVITISENTIYTSETLTNNVNVPLAVCEESIESLSKENELTRSTNLGDTENLPQNEMICEDSANDPNTYTKAGTIRKRKRFNQSLKVREEAKKRDIRENHGVKPPCSASCKKRCTQNIAEDLRKSINEAFWSLSDKERKAFMLHNTSAQPVKQRTVRPEAGDYRKNVSYNYSLKDERGTKIVVCKTFFLSTLGYKPSNDKPLHTALSNSKDTVAPPVDKRIGATPHNKIDTVPIKNHIMSFEPSISHYRREHAPYRLYLPTDLTILAMHKDFLEKNPSHNISYDKYRDVVQELNISFVKLGHEECEDCEEFRLHNNGHTKENLQEDCLGCNKWASHNERAIKSREQYKLDSEVTNNTDTIIYSADLQKVIMLPRIDMFKTTIFTHRIVVYNESFVPTGKGRKDCCIVPVLWHEGLFGRSKDEIISTYYHFFIFHRDKKNIILWVDNCSSQNKNWSFFSFLIYVVNSNDILADKIVIKYFEPGHTFMSADSFHHRVELSMKRLKNKIYDFADFSQAVGTAGKNVRTKEMTVEDFYDWEDYTTQYKLSRLNPRPYISEMVQVEVNRGSFDLTYKTGFDKEPITASIIGNKILKTKILPPPKKRTVPHGISTAKKENILNALQNIISQNRMSFWRELPTF